MKLWIPGGRGLLGKTLAQISVVPTVVSGSEVDISDAHAVDLFFKNHPDISHVVNCAAFSEVDPAETQKEKAFRANALGPEILALATCVRNLPFFHLSTDYVFPGNVASPRKETDEVAPCNYYGFTKLEGEKRALAANPKTCVLRTSWLFGPGGKNFIARLFHLMQTEKEVRLSNDQWGRPTYVLDLAHVIFEMLGRNWENLYTNELKNWIFGKAGAKSLNQRSGAEAAQPETVERCRRVQNLGCRLCQKSNFSVHLCICHSLGPTGLYQFANQGITTRYEFGCALREELLQLGYPLAVEIITAVQSSTFPTVAKRPCYSAFDTAKIEKLLLKPIRHWQEALKSYLWNRFAPLKTF